jgi:alpha-L-rhamnosidase
VLVEIQQWLLGVRPSSPGYETFDVAPPPTGLTRANGTVPTPRGTVIVGWERTSKDSPVTLLDLNVPPNATATVHLPGIAAGTITESGAPAGRSPGITVAPSVAGTAALIVGAGSYYFKGEPTRS